MSVKEGDHYDHDRNTQKENAVTHLSLRDENGYIIALSRSNGKVRYPLSPQFVPNSSQVVTAVKLDLVRHEAGAELFIRGVLKVPASLRLLDELTHRLFVSTVRSVINNAPDLQVFRGIPVLVLGRAFPRAQIRATGREGDFENIGDDEGGENMTGRGIHDADTFIGRPGEEATAGRIYATP